jgi:SAM-dependent methyltransferase
MSVSAFTKDQFNKIYPDGIGNHYWNHARNRIIGKVLSRHLLNRGRLVEIGCGRGVVLGYLRRRGMNCHGVELGDAEPLAGTREFVYTNTNAFELPEDTRKSMDAVLLFDVLEHLAEPLEFMLEIIKKFENARHLVVTVPARQELWTNYDAYNGHYKRYNLKDLENLSAPGLQLSEAGYFNHLLYPVFWVYARFIKKRGTDIKAPSGLLILIHRLLSVMLRADFAVFPSRLYGTSIIAVFSMADSPKTTCCFSRYDFPVPGTHHNDQA